MATTKGNMLFFLRILLANLFRRPVFIDPHADLPVYRRWKWVRTIGVFSQPMQLWQSPPSAYPRWCVGFFWAWAQRAPHIFDPRHFSGPRHQMSFYAFDGHADSIEQWILYAQSRNETWLLTWWPSWFVQSGVLARVACTHLWEKGLVFLWEHCPIRTAEAMFGNSIGNHPEFAAFCGALEHPGLAQLEIPRTSQWSSEVVDWIGEGRKSRVQAWMQAHARNPKAAWDYLGDGKQLRGTFDYFPMGFPEIKLFDAYFPLKDGWGWAKVLALYGVDVFGHEPKVTVDWPTMGFAWAEAAHICRQDGREVPAAALVRGIDWRLALCLGHPDWPSWTGPERIAALLMEPEAVEDVSIAGLV